MHIKYSDKPLAYTGKELRSLFIFHHFNLQGNAMVAFCGPCKVSLRELVDQEDVKLKAPIYSKLMLHFLAEFFERDLEKTVLRQRLLMACVLDALREQASKTPWKRRDDDIFVGNKKVSVSIATATPVSNVIHAGLNILSEETPVATFGLAEARIDPEKFAVRVMERFKWEMADIVLARCKVRGVP